MPLRLKIDRWGQCSLSGLSNDFAKYERDIFSGKIPCPFKVEFKDTQYRSLKVNAEGADIYEVIRPGRVVHTGPIPLKPSGEPKIHLFD